MKIRNLCIIAVFLLISVCFVGSVSAEEPDYDDLIGMEENESIVPSFINTEEYKRLYIYWYSYHSSSIPDEDEQRQQIRGYLLERTTDAKTKLNRVLTYIGLDDRLRIISDRQKYSINDSTGEITYALGFSNWLANLFGNGITENDLPHNIAEINALLDIYSERYDIYATVEWEIEHNDS